jgi:hypothetical protein
MSQVCAALSDFNFSSDDSSSSEEDEKVKRKQVDFTGLRMTYAIRINCFARFL